MLDKIIDIIRAIFGGILMSVIITPCFVVCAILDILADIEPFSDGSLSGYIYDIINP